MKKKVLLLFLLSLLKLTQTFGQSGKPITNLVWGRSDSVSTGLKMFFIDSLVKAHITYYDAKKAVNHAVLDFVSEEKNNYVFKGSNNNNDFWLVISAIDTPLLKVAFMVTNPIADNSTYKSLLSWKLMTNEKSKGVTEWLNKGGVIQDAMAPNDVDYLKSMVSYYKNVSCCTNHSTKHCASTIPEMAKYSKDSGCVF